MSLHFDGKPQFFFDDFLLSDCKNVYRESETAVKKKNPVLIPEKPWEARRTQVCTVLYDENEKLYKMWYSTSYYKYGLPKNIPAVLQKDMHGALMYATSKDGYIWEKPNLGVTDFMGSTDNNIVVWKNFIAASDSVVCDPNEKNPDKKYKLYSHQDLHGAYVAYSPDGIHWSDFNREKYVIECNDVLSVGWDDNKEQYIAGYKIHKGKESIRTQGFAHSKDGLNWSYSGIVFEPDSQDPPDLQFYGFTPFSYKGIYLGFLWRFRNDKKNQTMDVELVYSRDGNDWERIDRKPVIPKGNIGDFDSHMIMGISSNILVLDEEVRVYYVGWNEKHWDFRETPNRRNCTGIAKFEPDRFMAIKAEKDGIIITKLLNADQGVLSINARTEESGEIRAALLDKDGKIINGFSYEECVPMNGDNSDFKLIWNGKTTSDANEDYAVGFQINGASLFSMQYSER